MILLSNQAIHLIKFHHMPYDVKSVIPHMVTYSVTSHRIASIDSLANSHQSFFFQYDTRSLISF